MASNVRRVGDYEFQLNSKSCLGKGTFGIVYKGTHRDTKQKVAIKKINLNHEEDDRAIFNEVKSMDCLQDHRNVVRLLSAQLNIRDMECWVVLELCELGDLQKYISQNKENLTLEEKIYFMYQAVLPIAFMHSQKPPIIHRDIKPGNYLLKKEKSGDVILKVTDFGLAKLFDRNKATETMSLCGTQPYMAPEFWVDGDLIYDANIDNFSLGLMFLVLLEAKKGSKDIPLTVESKKEGYVAFVGQEMQRCFQKGKTMPEVVEVGEADSEVLTDLKFMVNDMIEYKPSIRLPLHQVQKKLESRLGKKLETMPPPFNTAIGNEACLNDSDSSLGSYMLDSIGYSLVHNQAQTDTQSEVKSVPSTQRNPVADVNMSVIEQLRNCLQSATMYGSVFKAGDSKGQFACEDVVRVLYDKNKVQRIQEEMGQWNEEMEMCIGFPGIITGVEKESSRIRFINQKTFTFSNKVLQKQHIDRSELAGGDYVVIKSDRKLVESNQSGFVENMAKMLGKPGIVRCVKDNKAKVEHAGKYNFWWSLDNLIIVAKCEEIMKVLLQNV